MSFSKQQLKIFAIIGVVVIALGVFLLINLRPSKVTSGPAVKLTVWGTESRSAWNELFASYIRVRPNVSFDYKEISEINYEQSVLDALAAGSGPDIFLIGNHDISKRIGLITPVDAAQFPGAQLDALFPRVVREDMVRGGSIYGLPLSLDGMVMLYNQDLFDTAGIATPPKTWDEVLNIIPQLRSVDLLGNVARAALALGGSNATVDHGVDALQLLMFQNGAQMNSNDGMYATFSSINNKGLAAFQFYLQFTNPNSPYFTWSEASGDSVDQFAAGNVAMILNYRSALDRVKAKSPFLKVAVTQVPVATGGVPTSVALYPALAVSRQSKASAWGWDFIIFATTDVTANKAYRDEVGAGPALREVLGEDINNLAQAPFARSALAARSWNVPDAAETERIFSRAIIAVRTQNVNPDIALRKAQEQINALYKR